jgi:hypothetical protein
MKDLVGNELKVGDLVAVYLARPVILGRIARITGGSIVTGLRHGGQNVTPCEITIACQQTVFANPQIGVAGEIAVLNDPMPVETVIERKTEGAISQEN